MPAAKGDEKRRRWTIWFNDKDMKVIEKIRAAHGLSSAAEAVRMAIYHEAERASPNARKR